MTLLTIILVMPVTGFVTWYRKNGLMDAAHPQGEKTIMVVIRLHVA